MEFPELPLLCRGKRSLGGLQCIPVALKPEILVNELHLFWKPLQQLPEYRLKPSTVRSLVVAEDDDRDRRILGPTERQAGYIELVDVLELENLESL